MKRIVAFSALLIFLTHDLAFAKSKVRLSTGEWLPFVSESLEHQGLISQLAREAFANAGIKMELGFFPWMRASELSKSGEWDGTIAFVRLKEREEVYLYSDILYTGLYVFFHLKSFSFQWTDYSDLKTLTMATTRGFGGMGQKFMQAEKEGTIKVLRLSSDTQSFEMLLNQRVQLVPSDLEVGYVYLHKLYGKSASKFTHNPNPIQRSEYHLVISKKIKNGPELIKKFNEGLKKLRSSGRYEEIVKAWYNKPIYKDSVPASYLSNSQALKR